MHMLFVLYTSAHRLLHIFTCIHEEVEVDYTTM